MVSRRGAYDSKAFGFQGRTASGHSSFATLADISSDWQVSPSVALNLYYAHVWGKSVVGAIYPAGKQAHFGYLEMVYRWNHPQRTAAK